VAAYSQWLCEHNKNKKVVVGRDARISGEAVSQIVIGTLRLMGITVVDVGLSTTPTVEMAVTAESAGGGIILTASHNPRQWNALKFLNDKGEFISAKDGEAILEIIREKNTEYAKVTELGGYEYNDTYIQYHIDKILALPLVKAAEVRAKNYKVVVDCINSTGVISIVPLLKQLGCEVVLLNEEPNGQFAHNPEPLPEHLSELSKMVITTKADLGIAVDPDVDRLVLVCEDGEMFGEEYTLVAVADYIFRNKKGNTVSNLSSTTALKKITEKYGGNYFSAAVGEVNVVEEMKRQQAVIGGEGNGGIIYPDLHYGRDAMVGIALYLSHLAVSNRYTSMLRRSFPNYVIVKRKVDLSPEIDVDTLLSKLKEKYKRMQIDTRDGIKIYLSEDEWVHLRKSNTEPIIRIYAESTSEVTADNLAKKIQQDFGEILKETEVG
jgi:phosphomannomutase